MSTGSRGSPRARSLRPERIGHLRQLREGRGADAPSRLVITETVGADAPTLLLQRNLSFANLDAGTYRLVIRTTDPENGESVERERLVPVR